MTKWVLVMLIVLSTTAGDLLLSREMKRHGEIDNFHPSRIGRLVAALAKRKFLVLGIAFMAFSFFAFMRLLTVADLSFAVPATAASYATETLLARYVLKERVDPVRWAGACLVMCGVALLAL